VHYKAIFESELPYRNPNHFGMLSCQMKVGLDDDTDWEDNDIVETHLAGGGLNGRDSTHIPTVSLASAGSPLGFESASPNLHTELLETVNLSTSVRHRTADEVPRESIRDRQLEWIREDPCFVRDVRESVHTAMRGKIHRHGLEENAASRDLLQWLRGLGLSQLQCSEPG